MMQLLRVSDNKRFLVKEDGTPFFLLGDTAWNLFHLLDRKDANFYLENRAKLGFNVILAVALAEDDGLNKENAYGRKPLLKNDYGVYDPTMPDISCDDVDGYSYWDHVDYIIDQSASLGLYIALLPTWGDKFSRKHGIGPGRRIIL